MQIDFNILMLIMLNIGLTLAFTYYGNRLFTYNKSFNTSLGELNGASSRLAAGFNALRPIKRFYVSRIRAKSDSDSDEPPHMPF